MEAKKYRTQKSHYGEETKDDLVEYNKKLQDFSLQISYICALETSGKMSPEESYKRVRELWKKLKSNYKDFKQDGSPLRTA